MAGKHDADALIARLEGRYGSAQDPTDHLLARLEDAYGTTPGPKPASKPKTTVAEAYARSAAEGFLPGAGNLMGLGSAIGEWAAEKLHDLPVERGFTNALMAETAANQNRLATAREEHPTASMVGGVTGTLAGLPGLVGAAGAKGADYALRAWNPTSLVGSVTKGAATAVGGYAATAPLTTGIATYAEGGTAGEALDAAGRSVDPRTREGQIGLGLSTVAGAAGGTVKRFADRRRDVRTQTGRTLQDIEEAGGKVKAFGDEPVTGGEFDTPTLRDAPEGREGINRVASQAGRSFTKLNRLQLKAARKDYAKQMAAVMDELPDEIPTTGLKEQVASVRESVLVNGKVPPQYRDLDKAVAEVAALLERPGGTKYRVTASGPDKGLLIPYEGVDDAIDPRDLLRVKQAVQDAAEFGKPVTPENRNYRLLYRAIADYTSSLDSRVAAVNKRFAATVAKLERANDIVFGSDTADIASRAASERRAAALFGRTGDPTQAGTVAAEQLDELAALDPAYQRLLTRTRAVKARESLRYGEAGSNQQSIETSVAQKGGGVLGLVGLSPRNREIAKVRLGLPIAETALKAGRATWPRTAQGVAALERVRDIRRREREEDEARNRRRAEAVRRRIRGER